MTTTFQFNKTNLTKAQEIISKYPEGRQRSAILPLLEMAQRQNNGWLSKESIEYVADMIQTPHIRAYEVVTFYTMFNTKPVGNYHLQVCGTTPCWLRGASDVMSACEKHLKIKCGDTTQDGLFTLSEVECLGACVDAPVVQINDDFFENATPETIKRKLDELKSHFNQ